MKNTRRIATFALALILILALAAPAFAADPTGTIKVTGSGTTQYQVYKIFDTTVVDGGHTYKLAAGWETFTAPDYFSVNDNGYVVWEKDTNSAADAAAIAQKAKKYVNDNSLTTTLTVSVGGELTVAPGYYLLVPANGPCGVTMVDADEIAIVEEKTTATGHPVVDKLVQEDSLNTYGKANDADIGQTIKFQTTITAGVNAEKYILHDRMDSHISFTGNVTVSRDGNEVIMANNYEVITDTGDSCAFHIVFTDSFCESLADDATVVVNYTGKLIAANEAAANDLCLAPDNLHTNETWLTYTADAVPSNLSSTTTQTYKITVNKKDQADNALAGAGFILRDNVGLYYKWNSETNSVEWVELADDAAKQAAAKITGDDGIIEFIGVDAENFTLEEVIVPNGYTGTTEVSVSTKSGNKAVDVENTLGTALPETGGIGTTVFYIGGTVLVLCALAALVVIKRKETSAQ